MPEANSKTLGLPVSLQRSPIDYIFGAECVPSGQALDVTAPDHTCATVHEAFWKVMKILAYSGIRWLTRSWMASSSTY